MPRNTELLEKVMTFINDNPRQHDQEVWGYTNECGTTACFAGWAGLMTGLEIGRGFEWRDKRGQRVDVFKHATKVLGLTWYQAEVMFLEIDTREGLELAVKDIVNGKRTLCAGATYDERGRG